MADRVGQRFGHYQLTRQLGKGGFAEVYLGRHIHLGSEAAIKVILNELSDADKELFIIEGRTLVRLIHPHIVRLLDFGIENNIPYFVMDYAPNGSLRDRHPYGTRLQLATIVAYVNQAAEALQYAHDQKLIHRDVKPENMLLGHNNEVVLSDFGIAVVAHSTKSMRIEDIIGTSYYMAPEQLSGQPRTASDQYSLAVIVYSWFTGTFPFTGTYVEIVSQQLTKLPPPIRNIVPTIPVEVEQVVLKALEKDPEQRYGSIRAFAQALEQVSQNWIAPTVRGDLPGQYQQQPVVSTQPQWRASAKSTPPQKTKEQWFREGIELYDANQLREAIAAYDRAIQMDVQYTDAYINRGIAYSDLEDYQKAIANFDNAIALNPKYIDAYINRANAYYELQEYSWAIADFDRAIALNPQFDNAYLYRGDVYSALKKYQRAIEDYDQAIILDPQNAVAYSSRGDAYSELQKYQRAIEDYGRAIILDPQDANVYYNRGTAYSNLKEYPRAIGDFDRAIALDPKDTFSYIGRGTTFYNLMQYSRAIGDFDRAIALNPQFALAYNNRGNAYSDLKEYHKAIADYNSALAIDPNFTEAKSNRAEAYRLLNGK